MSARIYFTVTRRGFCTDGTRIEFALPQYLAHLATGDRISLPAEDTPRGTYIDSNDIFVESGSTMDQERPKFESAGPDVAGTWTPRIGDSNYNRAAQADSGRFSHPRDKK